MRLDARGVRVLDHFGDAVRGLHPGRPPGFVSGRLGRPSLRAAHRAAASDRRGHHELGQRLRAVWLPRRVLKDFVLPHVAPEPGGPAAAFAAHHAFLAAPALAARATAAAALAACASLPAAVASVATYAAALSTASAATSAATIRGRVRVLRLGLLRQHSRQLCGLCRPLQPRPRGMVLRRLPRLVPDGHSLRSAPGRGVARLRAPAAAARATQRGRPLLRPVPRIRELRVRRRLRRRRRRHRVQLLRPGHRLLRLRREAHGLDALGRLLRHEPLAVARRLGAQCGH